MAQPTPPDLNSIEQYSSEWITHVLFLVEESKMLSKKQRKLGQISV
jgi:hypothetical protein